MESAAAGLGRCHAARGQQEDFATPDDDAALLARWPSLGEPPEALAWLSVGTNLGWTPRTLLAYARGLDDFLRFCAREAIEPLDAGRVEIAGYVRDLTARRSRRGPNIVALDSGAGLANATIQQRLVAVRLFYDYLVEEGRREFNPVGRGRYTAGRSFGSAPRRGLVPHLQRLPWIPTEEEWQAVLLAARDEPIRNRVMLALAYDAALRREELCALETTDLDPAHRTLRIRAETTKTRRERIVPYSAPTGVLLRAYLTHRRELSGARGPLFLSESRRNAADPITAWTWSKVCRALALRASVPRFHSHTLRHLCLTDLARAGWELHAIASFAGHRSPATTLQYIHLSGRELAARLEATMRELHAWRVGALAGLLDGDEGP